MQLSDRTTGGILLVLGAASAWGGSRLPGVPGQDVGPAAFPLLIGAGLMLCGALIAFGIGRGFEAPETDDPTPAGPFRLFGLRALIPPLLLVFYMVASEPLGFLLTAAVMVLIAAMALGARPVLAVPLALGAPVLVHLAFAKLLRVPLPEGLLAAPW